MREELRIAIGNAVETFGTLGTRMLREGDFATAGAALTCQHWLRGFSPLDRRETAPLPLDEGADETKAKKKERAPKAPAAETAQGTLAGAGAAPVRRGRPPKPKPDAPAEVPAEKRVHDTEPPPAPSSPALESNGAAARSMAVEP